MVALRFYDLASDAGFECLLREKKKLGVGAIKSGAIRQFFFSLPTTTPVPDTLAPHGSTAKNNTKMTEFKSAKDALVASLFELSKAANDAAAAAVNFYNLAEGADAAVDLNELLPKDDTPVVAKEEAAVTEKPKKKKAPKDPNAPKKPLTKFFAFSFHTREAIREERKKEGKPALSASDMSQIIKERYENMSDADKEYWEAKYKDELKSYQEKKEKYKAGLEANPTDGAAAAVAAIEEPKAEAKTDSKTDAPEEEEKKVKKVKDKKRKADKEKKDKGEKKKKSA